ncbi:Fic family protein [Actinomyces johnsonii]|uniref:Fic family protein n=1 Tax=Actinomyces johnsonii TaxID=544581 RepID=UPI003CC81328
MVRVTVGIGPSSAGVPRRRGAAGESVPPGVSADRSDGGVGICGAPSAATSPSAASATSPAVEALRTVAADERVRAAEAAVREACAELRWNEALRRRWREARAEAAIRGAIASGAVEGAVVLAEVLREQVAAGHLTEAATGDPGLDAVAGLWRAGTRLVGWMPDLVGRGRPAVPPARSLLAMLHRDVVGPLAAGGRVDLEEVGVPRSGQVRSREGGPGRAPQGEELAGRLEGLVELIEAERAPALVRAAIVHAEMLSARPFTAGNAAVGRLLVRHLLVRDGVEPTGTAVGDLYPGRVPAAYAEAAAAYASGTMEGVVAWVVWQAEAVLVGVQEARRLCLAVQAGTWRAG